MRISTLLIFALLGSVSAQITTNGGEVVQGPVTFNGNFNVAGAGAAANVGSAPTTQAENTQAIFNTGTLSNTQANSDNTLTQQDAANASIKSLLFSNPSDKVSMSHISAYSITGDMTIEAWVYVTDPKKYNQVVSHYATSGNYNYQLTVVPYIGYIPSLAFRQGSTTVDCRPTIFPINQWVHIAVTRSGTTITFYINGQSAGSATGATSPPSSTAPLEIGHVEDSGHASGYNMHGKIDEVSVWNVARTANQIASDVNTVFAGSESGLVGYWRINDGSGSTVADLTSNANTGTITGATWQTDTSNYATSGTRESPVYDISSAGTISGSSISWLADQGANFATPAVQVQTRYSTDGGSTFTSYATATSGSAIPGLSGATNLSNGRLQIKETLTSPSSRNTGVLSNLSASFVTPAKQVNFGAQTTPSYPIDAGSNPIRGAIRDQGGQVFNVKAYGAKGDGVTDDLAAFQAALAAIYPLPSRAGNGYVTGGILFVPRGCYRLSAPLEITLPIVLQGSGSAPFDASTCGYTTTLYMDGGQEGLVIPKAGYIGPLGTNGGYADGTIVRDIGIAASTKTGAPTGTVNCSVATCTWQTGNKFQTANTTTSRALSGDNVFVVGGVPYEVSTVTDSTHVVLGNTYFTVDSADGTNLTAHAGTFSTGWPNGKAININGTNYAISSVTDSSHLVLTTSAGVLAGQPAAVAGPGTLTGATFVANTVHGIDQRAPAYFYNVYVTGFPGDGFHADSSGVVGFPEEDFNLNASGYYSIKAISNGGHGFAQIGGNSQVSSIVGMDVQANGGWGALDDSYYGNSYSGNHSDGNKLGAYRNTGNAAVYSYFYMEGDQPPAKLEQCVGHSSPMVFGGYGGAGYWTDQCIHLSDFGGKISAGELAIYGGGISALGGPILFNPTTGQLDGQSRITFAPSAGAPNAGTNHVQGQNTGLLDLLTNAYSSGGAYTSNDSRFASWSTLVGAFNGGADYFKVRRAPATGGTPSFVDFFTLDSSGNVTVKGNTKAPTFQATAGVFSGLSSCAGGTEGQMAAVTDSSTATWGATITGSGSNHVLAYCDGTNWTVAGK